MTSTSRTIAGGIFLALLATPAAAGNPPPATFSATLTTSSKPKKPPPFKLEGIDWTCDGVHCRGRGRTSDVEASCRQLEGKMGQVKAFLGAGKILAYCRTPEASPAATPKSNPTPKGNPPPTGGTIKAAPVAAGTSTAPAPTHPTAPPPGAVASPPAGSPAVASGGAATMQQAGPEGAKTTVVVNRGAVPKVNLSISAVQWMAPQPLTDEPGFLRLTTGLVTAGARGATLIPRLFASGVTTTVGPQQDSSVAKAVVVSPVMHVKVKNTGTDRWASSGSVHVTISRGTPEEAAASTRERIAEGKTLVQISPSPLGVGTWTNSLAYAVSTGEISGSIGPGEEAVVQVAFLNGKTHPKDKLARFRYRMFVDKYYTAKVSLSTKSDETPRNDVAEYVFRVGPNGAVIEGKLIQRDSLRSTDLGNGVQMVSGPVRVTGGGEVTATKVGKAGIGGCFDASRKFCNGFTGSFWKADSRKKDCEAAGQQFLPKGCSGDERLGICFSEMGKTKETQYSYYSGYRSDRFPAGGTDTGEAELQCGVLKGKWIPSS